MAAYYNENDPFCVSWLRELIKQRAIADGEVDSRSIRDVRPDDLAGFRQCHFFAGIGAWSYALRLAGWSDETPAWTGSCPCQPFSVAGKRQGTADDRHLWPEFQRLIGECRPPIVFGEQVASKDGRAWLASVRSDVEAMGYALGAADLCAASIGAPHIRQRLYWGASRVEHADIERHDGGGARGARRAKSADASHALGMADHDRQGRSIEPERDGGPQCGVEAGQPGHDLDGRCDVRGPWRGAEWVGCSDGVSRPAQPGSFPLAHGAPARVGRLRGYGNAIVPEVAATFVESFRDCLTAGE